jgi:hypothetical protein
MNTAQTESAALLAAITAVLPFVSARPASLRRALRELLDDEAPTSVSRETLDAIVTTAPTIDRAPEHPPSKPNGKATATKGTFQRRQNPDYEAIRMRLLAEMKRRELPRKQVAETIGVPFGSLGRYLLDPDQGGGVPRPEIVERMRTWLADRTSAPAVASQGRPFRIGQAAAG